MHAQGPADRPSVVSVQHSRDCTACYSVSNASRLEAVSGSTVRERRIKREGGWYFSFSFVKISVTEAGYTISQISILHKQLLCK